MENLTKNKIQNLINSNPVMVFMKGTKLMPQCGFSNNVVQILNSLGVAFNTCLLYTSDAADEEDSVDLGGRRIIKNLGRIKFKISRSLFK